MKGRKPKPTALKKLAGTLRKHRTNKNEPEYLELANVPPAFLSEDGKAEWERMFPMLTASQVIDSSQAAVFAVMCETFADYVELKKQTREHGLIVVDDKGRVRVNPAFKAQQDCASLLLRYLAEIGLTPSSKTRVAGKQKKDENNPWSEFAACE